MAVDNSNAIEIFFSYAREDERLRDELEKHLSLLKRQGLIAEWYDRKISAGKEWEHEISVYLQKAQIILLLISANFLASDYCYSIEMEYALKRHENGEARVIPIILRPVAWMDAPFGKLVALPKDGKPVTRWQNRAEAFVDIAEGIRKVVEELHFHSTSNLPLSHDPVTAIPKKTTVFPQFWNVPFRRNPLFTGRQNALEQLHSALEANRAAALAQAISGLGGIGKTQIAIEYAYRFCDEYSSVFWFNAELYEALISDILFIAKLLKLPEKDEKDQNSIVNAVKRWLEENTHWLLIFDNIENIEMATNFIPPNYQGHILLTTRSQSTGTFAQRIEIEKMPQEEGILFLLRRAKIIAPNAILKDTSSSDLVKAREIYEAMDGLPLALDQAGAYIEETSCSLSNYLDKFHQKQATLLKWRGQHKSDHPNSVYTTFLLSFEKLEQTDRIAADLLRFCAFLYPDAIPEEIISESPINLAPLFLSVTGDLFALDACIAKLRTFSFVRRDRDAKLLNIHRLVQAVLKDTMDKNTQRQWAEYAVRAVNNIFPNTSYENWDRCQRYLPQAQICEVLIAEHNFVFPEAARLLKETGSYLLERSHTAEAEKLYKWALSINLQVYGSDHLEVANSINALGRLYHLQGNFAQAEKLYLEALTLRKKLLEPDHIDLANSFNNLGALYVWWGRYSEAETFEQQSLMIRNRVLGPEHPDTAIIINNLAVIYFYEEKFEQAKSLYQQTLELQEKIYGPDHPYLASTLDNLASAYAKLGKFEQAEPLYRRALKIRKKVYGANHPQVATSLDNLGLFNMDQGKFKQAKSFLNQALRMRELTQGPEHPNVATTVFELAEFYNKQGQYKQAEPLFKRALAIRTQQLGVDQPLTIEVLKAYVNLLKQTGRNFEAEELEKNHS
jgi:tetratricopeptide (TPR) repeat protein